MKLIAAILAGGLAVTALGAGPAAAYDPDRDAGSRYNGKRDYQYNGTYRGYYYGDRYYGGGRDKRCDVVMRNGREVRRCW
jgi:hypothetical protein